MNEVQTISTTADVLPAIQSVTTSANPGSVLNSEFTLELDLTSTGGASELSGTPPAYSLIVLRSNGRSSSSISPRLRYVVVRRVKHSLEQRIRMTHTNTHEQVLM